MTHNLLLNEYRTKKIGDAHLVTVDSGEFTFLTHSEFNAFVAGNVDDELYSQLCKVGIIVTADTIAKMEENYKSKYAHLLQGTSLHIMIITQRCNLACHYCHSSVVGAHDLSKDMSIETAKKTVDFIFQSPSTHITIEFQGGEPTLNIDTLKFVVAYAKEKNLIAKKDLKFALVSNLQFMTEELLQYIIKEGIGLCTSLDGPKIVHDKNRGFGSYDRLMKWVDIAKNKYKIPLGALLVCTKYSIPYPKEIVDEYINQGFTTIQLKPLNKLGYANLHWDHLNYTVQDFVHFWQTAMDHIITNYAKIDENITTIMLRKLILKQNAMFTELESPCGGIIGQMAYNIDGSIYTCDEGRSFDEFKLGHVSTDTYRGVFSSQKAANFIQLSTNDTMMCNSCAYKPYCGLCPVCQFSEQNNPIPILSVNSRCQILLEQFKYLFTKIHDGSAKGAFTHWLAPYDTKN